MYEAIKRVICRLEARQACLIVDVSSLYDP